MSTTLIIDRRPDPAMPKACGSGCGCASAATPPAPPPSGGRVAVNGVEIAPEEIASEKIAREIQHRRRRLEGGRAGPGRARADAPRPPGRRASWPVPSATRPGGWRWPRRRWCGAALAPAPRRAGEAECRRYYEANRHRFRMPDLVEASHILFEPASDDAAGWGQAEREAQAIAAELGDDPGDFAAPGDPLTGDRPARRGRGHACFSFVIVSPGTPAKLFDRR
ncbi:peptidyl-prolyl cis-trans isomerase [Methylobacterium currus]|uniref:Peptidyl-prolyl cis-trans isomerase n=1 Tax=Methylobacterium currus TaxID=2051553 RepID=A0A2R4WSH5_9HYPH|nr:peptidylprolyl isomerase [Methylobacterium currus]AWB24497.1 peptidyl-prolyl cis-trans isomerase [Methylobacterium currus]